MTISVCSWHFTLSYHHAIKRHKVLTNKQLLRLSFPVLPIIDVYWKDDKTKADFYCYFPYGTPSDLISYAFSIKEDQSTEQAYKDSEFLYGKTSGVAPTEKAVVITTNHIFSCAVVTVQPGNGFTTESLAKANVSIMS